jgi:uncharacterized repeat protein (TIGR01451 family)
MYKFKIIKNTLIAFCFLFVTLYAHAQWENLNGPSVGFLNNINAYKQTVVMSDLNDAYLSFDKGISWRIVRNIPSQSSIQAMSVNEEGIFIQKQDNIYFSSDKGLTWQMSIIVSNENNAFERSSQKNEFVFTDSMRYLIRRSGTNFSLDNVTIYACKKGKNNWIVDKQFPAQIKSLAAYKNNIVCLAKDSFYISKTDKIEWSVYLFPVKDSIGLYSPTKWTPIAMDDDKIIVVSKSNSFYPAKQAAFISKNKGATWSKMSPLPDSSAAHYCLIVDKNIYVRGQKVYFSTNDGLDWKPLNNGIEGFSGPPTNPTPIGFAYSDSLIYLPTELGLFSLNNSNKWQYKATNTTKSIINSLLKTQNNNLLASNGTYLFTSKDDGLTWYPIENAPAVNLSIYGSNKIAIVKGAIIYAPGYYLATGASGQLEFKYATFSSNDNGISWQIVPNFPYYGGALTVGDTLIISTAVQNNEGKLLYSTKSPYDSWTVLAENTFDNVLAYKGGYLFTTKTSSFNISKYQLSSKQFISTFSDGSIPTTNLNYSNFLILDNKIYFTGAYGLIVSEDDGKTWLKKVRYPAGNTMFLTNLSKGALLAGINRNGNGLTGFYASTDGGDTWNTVNSGLQTKDMFIYSSALLYKDYVYCHLNSGMKRRPIADFTMKNVFGNVYLDKNNNGLKDINEIPLSNIGIFATKTKAFTLSDTLGIYNLLADLSNKDTIKAKSNNKFAQIKPSFYIYDSVNINNVNFGIYMPSTTKDVSITLSDLTPPRPGFSNLYNISYTNEGSVVSDGTITMSFDSILNKITANPAPSDSTLNSYTWQYSNLNSNENRYIKIETKTPASTPLNKKIKTIVKIVPSFLDTLLSNNVDTLIQTVVGSFDPNDKQVSFINSKSSPSVVDTTTELIYTIRFQNTGNYPADFVKVVDTLSDLLDISTLKLITTSHNYVLSVKNKNTLIFDFNPIYLVDSFANEKASHGFVKFSIKPKKNLLKDDIIKNKAFIYFDYNTAIITNTVETANQKSTKVYSVPSYTEGLDVFPNPAFNTINISTKSPDFINGELSLYDINGRLLGIEKSSNTTTAIDIERFAVGEYICVFKSNGKLFTGKFLKIK